MRLRLKDYQTETLGKLGDYCDAVRSERIRGNRRPEREAFERETERDYFSPPGFDGVPYVCLRLPTGGGKTLLAAHALGTVGRRLLGTDAPACLWITPNTTIRDQTLRVLRDKPHDHHRLALVDALGSDVEVITLEEALTTGRSVLTKTPVVVVTTIQSYRVRDDRSGQEIEANRRIYRDNGYLQRAFEDLPEATRDRLSKDAKGLIDLSLANALLLRAPIVIMDEAHNARTPTSFESLSRFGPSCVIELTATPQHQHDPARDLYASNVLHAVSALALKNEGMIKLPVDLESRGDWLEVLAATKQRREELEMKADEWSEEEGGPPIRPIALIQAQAHSKTRETHTAEVVKQALLERLHVPPAEIRICTGTVDEIGDENLMEPECQVRYVITVDKLREGWDCPFAYILGSIGNAATPTAVEQVLGRVLRMPFATPTRVPALDRAYAFVLSDNIVQTAMELRDRLVESCGFDERSAADALRVTAKTSQTGFGFGRIPISQEPKAAALPDSLRAKSRYNEETKTLEVAGTINHREATALRDAVERAEDKEAVEAFWQRERAPGTAAKRLNQYAEPVRVPRLSVLIGKIRTLFEPEELDTFSWNLNACPFELSRDDFPDEVRVGSAATIDVQEEGGLFTAPAGEVRLRQLELIGEGDDWAAPELARWLDDELHRDETFLGVPKALSQPWMHRVVDHLANARQLSLPVVVRRRHPLSELLRGRIAAHGRAQARRAAELLIQQSPTVVETSPDMTFDLEETAYAPYNLHSGHTFKRHAFQLVAAMNGAELECATRIDGHSRVKRWVRNPDRETQGGFWLPKSPGRFFPDFIAELTDGVIVLVEYKMKKMASDPEEIHKKAVGELWAARSNGKCRFVWIVDADWAELGRQLT